MSRNPYAKWQSYLSATDKAQPDCKIPAAHRGERHTYWLWELSAAPIWIFSFSVNEQGSEIMGPVGADIFFWDILPISFTLPPPPKKRTGNSCSPVGLISPLQRGSCSERSLLLEELWMTCALFTTRLGTAAPRPDKADYCRKMDFSAEELR